MLVCALFVHLAHETAGAARTRSSLRPLFEEGQRNANLGRHRAARSRNYINVIASAAKQSSVSTCGAMDCFAALAMTWREQASLVPHLERPRRGPEARATTCEANEIAYETGRNPERTECRILRCSKSINWPLLTGNGNPVRILLLVRLVYKLRSRLVALCKNNGEETCAN